MRKWFPEKYPKVTLKGVKTFRGMDAHGYNLTVVLDGKPIIFSRNDGSGGQSDHDFLTPEAKEWLKSEVERLRLEIPPDKEEYGMKDRDIFCADIMIEEMMFDWKDWQALLRSMKKYTVFMRGDEVREITRPFSPEIKAHLTKKFGTDVVILNETFVKYA